MSLYGIALSDEGEIDWNRDQAHAAYSAVLKMADKLGGSEIFTMVFRGTTLKLEKGSGYGGRTKGMTIIFHGNIDAQIYNIDHEFGHVFNNIFHNRPENVLNQSSIFDSNGNFVMGRRNGNYDRQPGRGYNPACVNGGVCSTEQHPRSWEPEGNTASEEWADLFLNYVQETFADDSYGSARENWTYIMIFTVLSPGPYFVDSY